MEVGVGGHVSELAGAEVDDRFAPPIKIEGEITAIKESDNNTEVVVKSGNIYTIVTEKEMHITMKEIIPTLD